MDSVEGSVKAELIVETGEVDSTLQQTEEQARKTEEELGKVKQKEQETQIESIAMLTSLGSVAAGVAGVTNSIATLVPMSDEARVSFSKFAATIQLFVSTCQLLKGAAKLFDMLSLSMVKSAVASIGAAFAANPIIGIAGVAAVSAGIGAGAAYFLAQDNRTTNNIIMEAPRELPQSATINSTGGWT